MICAVVRSVICTMKNDPPSAGGNDSRAEKTWLSGSISTGIPRRHAIGELVLSRARKTICATLALYLERLDPACGVPLRHLESDLVAIRGSHGENLHRAIGVAL